MPHVKFVVAGSLILGTVCYLMFSGINDSMVYYYSLSELTARSSELAGKGIRISGYVEPDSIQKDIRLSKVVFTVFDRASDHTLPVTYQGVIPDTFKDNAEVVVEGIYRPEDPVFHARTLLAKCPSKYEAMGEEHPKDIPIKKEAAQ